MTEKHTHHLCPRCPEGKTRCTLPGACVKAGTTTTLVLCEKCARGSVERDQGRREAFAAAIEECETYSKGAQSEEAKAVAMNLAVRIAQRAKREQR